MYCTDLTRGWLGKSLDRTEKFMNRSRDLKKRISDFGDSTILPRHFSAVHSGIHLDKDSIPHWIVGGMINYAS